MQRRRLGALEVPAIGLGCMGMSEFYGPSDETEAIATIHRAIDLGVTLLDTADMYGPFTNEELVGRAIRGRRDQVILATKCGIVRDQSDLTIRGIDGSPAYILMACEASLKRLGVDHVDLYQLHRIDPKGPIEASGGALAELGPPGATPPPRQGRRGPARARPATSVSRRPARRPCGARRPCIRSPRCRPSTRSSL